MILNPQEISTIWVLICFVGFFNIFTLCHFMYTPFLLLCWSLTPELESMWWYSIKTRLYMSYSVRNILLNLPETPFSKTVHKWIISDYSSSLIPIKCKNLELEICMFYHLSPRWTCDLPSPGLQILTPRLELEKATGLSGWRVLNNQLLRSIWAGYLMG